MPTGAGGVCCWSSWGIDTIPSMKGLGVTMFRRGRWKAEDAIEGPCENNGIDEEECQEAKIGQERTEN